MAGVLTFIPFRSGQNIQPPATLFTIKVEVKIKPDAKSKKSCHSV